MDKIIKKIAPIALILTGLLVISTCFAPLSGTAAYAKTKTVITNSDIQESVEYSKKNPVSLKVEGEVITSNVSPIIVKGRTLIPARAVFESIGAEVEWDSSTQQVEVAMDDTNVVLSIGSDTAVVNGDETALEVPALIVDNSTMIPVRFVAESLDFGVDWDSASRTVEIDTTVAQTPVTTEPVLTAAAPTLTTSIPAVTTTLPVTGVIVCETAAELTQALSVSNIKNSNISLSAGKTYTLASKLVVNNADGVTIYGNGATIDGCIDFDGNYAKNINIMDVNFLTTRDIGFIGLYTTIENFTLNGCTFTQNSTTWGGQNHALLNFNPGESKSLDGFTAINCKFVSFANNNPKVGLKFWDSSSGTPSEARNVTISNCNFDHFHGFGIETNCFNGAKISNSDFTSCHDSWDPRDGQSMGAGISAVMNCRNVTISDCTFKDSRWGIEMSGQGFTVDNCYFSGSIDKDNIIMTGDMDDLLVSKCTFIGGKIAASANPIVRSNITIDSCKFIDSNSVCLEIAYQVNGLTLSNNYFRNAGRYYWYSANALVYDAVLQNNTFETNAYNPTEVFNSYQNKAEIVYAGNTYNSLTASL